MKTETINFYGERLTLDQFDRIILRYLRTLSRDGGEFFYTTHYTVARELYDRPGHLMFARVKASLDRLVTQRRADWCLGRQRTPQQQHHGLCRARAGHP